MPLHEHHRDGWLHVTVLESVIEHQQVKRGIGLTHGLDAFHSVLAHGYGNSAFPEFPVDLIRFVADGVGGAVFRCKDKTFGLAFIATAKDTDVVSGA